MRFGSVPASGLEPNVGGDETAAVPEVSGLRRTTGPKRFAEILDDEAGRAACSDQVFPPMQMFDGSLFSIGSVGHFRQRDLEDAGKRGVADSLYFYGMLVTTNNK